MDFIAILSTIILVSTLVTILLAVGSYTAFRVREKRKPKPATGASPSEAPEKAFFVRYRRPQAEA